MISLKTLDHRPDLVQRDFHAQAPGRLWVADITYVRTLSGFAYTAFDVDVFSRKIVGVATRSTMRTDALPMEALDHATPQEVETEYYLTQPINTGL